MTIPEWRVVRVAMALALIFVAGVATGRWTAPHPAPVMQFRPLPPPAQAQGNPEVAINHMLAYIDLTPEQIAAIRPILTKWVAEIQEQLRCPRSGRRPSSSIFRRSDGS